MIIGHGDIAGALRDVDRDDLLFFAAGVSNSREDRQSEYQREVDLLAKQDPRSHIVYFSTLAVFYGSTRYVNHKLYMESVVKDFSRYTIVRLGNITWGKNPHTLINFLRAQIKAGEKLTIQDAYRYIVDKQEFQHWIKLIPSWDCEMNIIGKRLKVKEIVKIYGHAGVHNRKV